MMDANQISDVPFNFLGRVGFFYIFVATERKCLFYHIAVDVCAYVRTTNYAPVCCSTGVATHIFQEISIFVRRK